MFDRKALMGVKRTTRESYEERCDVRFNLIYLFFKKGEDRQISRQINWSLRNKLFNDTPSC